jgi:hypothetical protein
VAALYLKNPTTEEFTYAGQTECIKDNHDPDWYTCMHTHAHAPLSYSSLPSPYPRIRARTRILTRREQKFIVDQYSEMGQQLQIRVYVPHHHHHDHHHHHHHHHNDQLHHRITITIAITITIMITLSITAPSPLPSLLLRPFLLFISFFSSLYKTSS